MRLLALLVFVVISGCSGYTATLPDGGRGLVNCDGTAITVPVQVNDKLGAPAPDATVTLTWTSYDVTNTYKTDGRGVAVITPQFGPGVVKVQGSLNDLTTPVAQIEFVGGDCISAVTPRNLVLQLN